MEVRDRQRLKDAVEDACRRYGLTHRKLMCDMLGYRSHGMLGYLLSGRRKTCSPELALALELALHVQQGALFRVRVPSDTCRLPRKDVAA